MTSLGGTLEKGREIHGEDWEGVTGLNKKPRSEEAGDKSPRTKKDLFYYVRTNSES
jgi:hypothetical protein